MSATESIDRQIDSMRDDLKDAVKTLKKADTLAIQGRLHRGLGKGIVFGSDLD